MASITESRTVPAPREEVWKVLADVENARRWNGAWTRIEISSAQRHGLGTRFRARAEEGDGYEFEITEWSPPARIAFAPIREAGETYGVELDAHVFELSETSADETLVKLTARATAHGVRGHIVARFFWPGYQRQGLQSALDALEAFFSPGGGETEEEEGAEAGSSPSD